MIHPEEALDEARRRAAAHPHASPGFGAEGSPESRGVWRTGRQLARWALVEPDRAQVYSTRRMGAPITAVKRLLIRLLRQYLDQVTAQQVRFNAHAASYMLALEDRVSELERQLAAQRANEPQATELQAAEPQAAEPQATELPATQPKATEAKATEPRVGEDS